MASNDKVLQRQVERENRSVKEHIEELRGKIHLLNKDFEACRGRTTEDTRLNEQRIAQLRAENRAMRVQLVKHENGDRDVIMKAFQDEGKECRALHRATAGHAMVKLDETVCQGNKNLNATRYEKSVTNKKLEGLQDQYAGMLVEAASIEEDAAEPSVSCLENDLDKALIKCETSRTIGRKYSTILERLKEENLSLPGRLTAMEELLRDRQKELGELRALNKKALLVRQEAKNELVEKEAETSEAKRLRDAGLAEMRREVEQRTLETEKVLRRAMRANTTMGDKDVKGANDNDRQEQQKTLLNYEDQFLKIKEATRVTSVSDVMDRVLNQDTITNSLQNQVKNLDQTRKRLVIELAKLQQEYHESKFTGDTKLSNGQMKLEEMKEQILILDSKKDKLESEAKSWGETLVRVRGGVKRLFDQLRPVRLRPPHHKCPSGDVFAQLEVCQLKLEQLLKDLGNSTQEPDVQDALMTQEFQTFQESQMWKQAIRVPTTLEEAAKRNALDYDSEDNEEALGRQEIKNMSQRLVDSHNKPKKRKAKKK